MSRAPSTISRELRRNRGQRGYRPKQAQALSQARWQSCQNGPRVPDETWVVVDDKLGATWSREQIAGYLKANGEPTVSHECIYRLMPDERGCGCKRKKLNAPNFRQVK